MGKKARKLGTDFTKGYIPVLLIRFLIPFLLANILNSIYNTVDMIIIGKYAGSVGTVAVSLGGKMLNLFTFLATGLSAGGQVLIAQELGAGQKEELNSSIGTLFSILGILSVVLAVGSIMGAGVILRMLNVPVQSYSQAWVYLVITSAGLPLVFGYNAVCSVLRGMGDSRNPLLFIAVAAVVNLVLDLVLIVICHMGAAGTALATIIGQAIAFGISVVKLYRERDAFCFDFRLSSFCIKREKLITILEIGIPTAAQSVLIGVTQLFMISYVNAFGLVQAAAFGIGDKVITLSNIVTQSVKQAGGSVVAQNLGAEKPWRARQVVRASLFITLLFAGILSVVSLIFPNLVFGLFTEDTAVLAYSQSFIRISAAAYILAALSGSYMTMTLGCGNARLNFISGVLDGIVCRIGFCFFFGLYLNMQVTGFFMGSNLARIAVVLVNGVYYYSGKWMNRKLLVKE